MPVSFYKYKFVFTGGGTGGHIMPLIAMNTFIQEYPSEILYIGEKGGREENITKDNNINFEGILASKWHRFSGSKEMVENVLGLFKIVLGFLQSIYFLVKFQPDAVLSKGGYVSLPVVAAAALLRIPIVVHESDAVIGATNRFGSRYAKKVATGFPVELYDNLDNKLVFTGTPAEKEFWLNERKLEYFEQFHLNSHRPILLITGGIQGAHGINSAVKKIIPKLLEKWQIIHLCGEYDYRDFKKFKDKLEDSSYYRVFATLGKERIAAMSIADVAITRASATTLTELSLLDKMMIIVPLPTAASDHQRKNAEFFKEAGIVMEESEIKPKTLLEAINDLKYNEGKQEEIHRELHQIVKPDAGKLLTELLIQSIHE